MVGSVVFGKTQGNASLVPNTGTWGLVSERPWKGRDDLCNDVNRDRGNENEAQGPCRPYQGVSQGSQPRATRPGERKPMQNTTLETHQGVHEPNSVGIDPNPSVRVNLQNLCASSMELKTSRGRLGGSVG